MTPMMSNRFKPMFVSSVNKHKLRCAICYFFLLCKHCIRRRRCIAEFSLLFTAYIVFDSAFVFEFPLLMCYVIDLAIQSINIIDCELCVFS